MKYNIETEFLGNRIVCHKKTRSCIAHNELVGKARELKYTRLRNSAGQAQTRIFWNNKIKDLLGEG